MANGNIPDTSYAFKVLGHRSLFSWIFGTFFADSRNTSGLLALSLIVSAGIIFFVKGTVPSRLVDAILLVIGFYFGGASAKPSTAPPNPRDLP